MGNAYGFDMAPFETLKEAFLHCYKHYLRDKENHKIEFSQADNPYQVKNISARYDRIFNDRLAYMGVIIMKIIKNYPEEDLSWVPDF